MNFLLFLLFSCFFPVKASLPELFGSSAGSLAIGNQAESNSAANNYYASALQGFSRGTKFSFNTFYLNTHFTPIHNVVTTNESTSVNTFERSNVNVNPSPTTMFGAHFSTPLFTPESVKLNISIFAPFDRLMEADTGEPYTPQYAMYGSRFTRPTFLISGSHSLGDWSYSLGGITGLQSNGETYFITRTTSGNPSLARMSFNAKPSLGFTASVAKKSSHGMSYFAFQQEMKSKLINHATGETEIASNSSFPFDFKISSLLYYDPMTLRLGQQLYFSSAQLFFSLEYQQWTSYESSMLKLKKQGGTVNGSQNFEKLNLRNIFIPKVGLEKKFAEKWSYKLGYFYRPSPMLNSALKGAGNTIDSDKHVGSLGTAYEFSFLGKTVVADLAYQAHFLRSYKVIKTDGQENGNSGERKIGSPGYRIGGMIHSIGLGLSWML